MLFIPERRSIGRYERTTELGRITQEHVDNVLKWITDRDLEILFLLFKHPFMRADQIELILFHDLSPSSSRTKLNQRLQKLYDNHCIDRWFPIVKEGTSQQHVILDRLGFKVLAQGKLGFDSEGAKWRKTQRIPQDYIHTLKIYDFKALLKNLEQRCIIDELRWGMEKKLRFKKKIEKNGKVKIIDKEIMPDAIFGFQHRLNSMRIFFLEIDNATEPVETLQQKMRNYKDFYGSGEWKEMNFGLTGRFPSVVFILHEEQLAKDLCRFARGLKSNIRFLFTTYPQLTEQSYKQYVNKLGKTRNVTQEFKIRLLDQIFLSSKEEGLTTLV